MTVSPAETQTALQMLSEVRRKQSKAIDAMANDWRQLLRFEADLSDLTNAVTEFGSRLPSEPTSQQATTVRRDIIDFKADMSALRCHVDELAVAARDVKDYMTDIKATLDILQTRFEESDV